MLSYLYDIQIYTNYIETLTGASGSRQFDRDGRAIPGIVPNVLDARLLYDRKHGLAAGAGGFLELVWHDGASMDNANLLRAPGYTLVNLNLHYDPPLRLGLLHRLHLFFEIENLFGQTVIASAANIADSLTASGAEAGGAALASRTGSIYAGAPRAFFGGVKVKL